MNTVSREELHKLVSGAIYDFMGSLSTLDEGFSVGASEHPSPLIEAFLAWAAERGLECEEPWVNGWNFYLTTTSLADRKGG